MYYRRPKNKQTSYHVIADIVSHLALQQYVTYCLSEVSMRPPSDCRCAVLLQYSGSLLAATATPRLADLHQLMREQVGWPDSWGLDVFTEVWTAGSCSLRLLDSQASLPNLGLRHGDVLCYQRSRQNPQVRADLCVPEICAL